MTTVAVGIASATLIAASAALDRAWWRARSRRASRGATGSRAPTAASTRIASGPTNSRANPIASVPRDDQRHARRSPARRVRSVVPLREPQRHDAQHDEHGRGRRADRRARLGRGGREDRASVIGTRAAARAGRHAAAVAVRTASSMAAVICHHGRSSRSMRCPAAVSNRGVRANHSQDTRDRADHRRRDADHGAVGQQHETKVSVGRPDRGEQAELAQPAVGDDGEAGRRDEADEQHAHREDG